MMKKMCGLATSCPDNLKMPKIDTLDALDDEMTLILNTL